MDMQVSKLKVLKQSYLSEHYALEDRILQHFPKEIKELEQLISAYESDAPLLEQHKPTGEDKFCPMTLQGVTYTGESRCRQNASCYLQGISDDTAKRNWQLSWFQCGDLL
ncbi:MAG: hypothetical protein ACLTC8_06325 [Lachnospiraceae bacterium]